MWVLSANRGTLRRVCLLCVVTGSILRPAINLAEPAKLPTKLPIEIMGADGSEVAVPIELPPDSARQVKSLWLQVHGLEYPDLASVCVNNAQWVSLNNHNAAVAQPGLSYGGIGGAFA